MNESQLNGATKSYGIALGVACILSAMLVVVKETNATVLDMMKRITVHHWVTQSVFIVATFLVLGFVLNQKNHGQGPNVSDAAVLQAVVGGVVLGAAIISLFYLME